MIHNNESYREVDFDVDHQRAGCDDEGSDAGAGTAHDHGRPRPSSVRRELGSTAHCGPMPGSTVFRSRWRCSCCAVRSTRHERASSIRGPAEAARAAADHRRRADEPACAVRADAGGRQTLYRILHGQHPQPEHARGLRAVPPSSRPGATSTGCAICTTSSRWMSPPISSSCRGVWPPLP